GAHRVLLLRERVAVNLGALDGARDAIVAKIGEHAAILQPVVGRELARSVELPVARLGLAPMPLEQVGHRAPGPLRLAVLLRGRGQTREQPRGAGPCGLALLAALALLVGRRLRTRPPELALEPRFELGPARLEEVAQAERRDAVVLVVTLDVRA